MGTSFVEYKGFGFWTRDRFLQSWLTTLLSEMQGATSLQLWQEELMQHWRIQADIDGGTISLEPDKFLVSEARREFVVCLAQQALVQTPPLGHQTGELFLSLLTGKLKTTDSSPISYLHEPENME